MTDPVAKLVPGPTDSEIAADLRRRAREAGEALAAILTEAGRHGMICNVVFGNDQTGRRFVQNVEIVKLL